MPPFQLLTTMLLAGLVCVPGLPADPLSPAVARHALSFGTVAASQQAAADDSACCTVVAVNLRSAVVTARETASGYTFRFTVRSRRLLNALKVGDKVWADFGTKRVRVRRRDASPCCTIIGAPVP